MNPLDSTESERVVASQPSWVSNHRSTGLAAFEKLGMPSSLEEVWRYVDLDFELADFEAAGEVEGSSGELVDALDDAAAVVDVVDGFAAVTVPSQDDVVVATLRSLGPEAESAAIRAFEGGVAPDTDIFAAAHSAFSPDGTIVHAPARSVTRRPVFIDCQAVTAGAVSFPHIVLDAAESSQLSVVVGYRSEDGLDAVVVPRLEISVGANANLDVTVVQHWGSTTRSISHVTATAANDATVTLAEAGLGGSLSRLHLNVDLEGRGSHAEIIGAYFGGHSQTLDYRYFMRHVGESTTSNMYLKGGVEDEALSVFTGMIRIEESAQGTNAFQTNRNLILSEGASAQSVPNLEILANDVRCGHGSTMGPLDEEQRYYLMSRGLDPERADRLQVRGFFQDALNRFPLQAVAAPVRDWINAKYVTAQQEGRV